MEDLQSHAYAVHSIDDCNQIQYKCYDCQQVFEHYNDFLNHVRMKHHSALKLRCDACDLLCKDSENYAKHRNNECLEANNFPNNFPCSHCSKSFRSHAGRELHVRRHEEGQFKSNFPCNQCPKEFLTKGALILHKRTHKSKHLLSIKVK